MTDRPHGTVFCGCLDCQPPTPNDQAQEIAERMGRLFGVPADTFKPNTEEQQ